MAYKAQTYRLRLEELAPWFLSNQNFQDTCEHLDRRVGQGRNRDAH